MLYLGMLLVAIYSLTPFLWAISTSLKSEDELFGPARLIPRNPSLENYLTLLSDGGFLRAFGNSVVVAGGSALLALFAGSFAAYALGRLRFRGKIPMLYAVLAMTGTPLENHLGELWAQLDAVEPGVLGDPELAWIGLTILLIGSIIAVPGLAIATAPAVFVAEAENSIESDAAAIYDTEIRNLPSPERPNTTLYLLAPSEDPGSLRVLAVYEIDFVPVSSPAGTYASARRYKNGTLTHYYDIFYEGGPGSLPVPSFVAFETTSRAAVAEGTAIDRFKIADWSPFYFVWLPDPAINPHKIANASPVAAASSPRSAYEHLGPRSSLSLVAPIFPNL